MIPSSRIPALLGFALAAALAAPAAAADRREARPVPEFAALGLSAPIKVNLALGDAAGVVLEGEAGALADIETVVEGASLKIRMKRGREWRREYSVVAHVSARRIEALSVSGSGEIVAARLDADALSISVAGSGDVSVGGGTVARLNASIAGSGDLRAGRLQAQRVKVSIAGSGGTTVWAQQSLDASVTGSGDIRFYGDPAVDRAILGTGSVKRLGASPS